MIDSMIALSNKSPSDVVLNDFKYATEMIRDKIQDSTQQITIFTTSLDDRIDKIIDDKEIDTLTNLCSTYKLMFEKEKRLFKPNLIYYQHNYI